MRQNRTNLVLGLLLILVGGWLILTHQVLSIQHWLDKNFMWPMWVIGAGIIILFIGLLTGAPGMAIPAAIVAGIGGILYYQELHKDYTSWSYMWALIPGFVGVGQILAGLLGENTYRSLARGLRLLVISVVLFLAFGTIFGGVKVLGPYGVPILIILLGVYLLARGFMRSGGGGNGVSNETR